MDEKKYIEMKQSFTEYLTEKKLRKTEERYAIFECICRFAGHFDMYSLQEKLEEANFHVSKATLYNTLDVLEDGGLIVRHQLNAQSVQYELRALAETHLHLVCMKCGAIREMKDSVLKKEVNNLRYPVSHRNFMRCISTGYAVNASSSFSRRIVKKNINSLL